MSAPTRAILPSLRAFSPSAMSGSEKVIGPGRAAAEMPLRHVAHSKARRLQRPPGLQGHALAMLQGAGRLIGDGQAPAAVGRRRKQAGFDQIFADVARQAGDATGDLAPDRVVAENMSVILELCPATRRVGDDGVEPVAGQLDREGRHQIPGVGFGLILLAQNIIDMVKAADINPAGQPCR